MNTKNTFVKKLTALVLCLCMVLPMVTTGFAPMMALLDTLAPQADAAASTTDISVVNYTNGGYHYYYYTQGTTFIQAALGVKSKNAANIFVNLVGQLEDEGYSVSGTDRDLNDGAGGKTIKMGYKTTTDPKGAATKYAISCSSGHESNSDIRNGTSFPAYYGTASSGTEYYVAWGYSSTNDLNEGCSGSADLFFCHTTDTRVGAPVTSINIWESSNPDSNTARYLHNKGYADLNRGAGGDDLRLRFYSNGTTDVSSALQSLQDTYNKYNHYLASTNYTASSFSAFKTAMDNAESILNAYSDYYDSSYTAANIEAAKSAIETSVAALQAVVYFDVNYDNVKPNLFVANSATQTINGMTYSFDPATDTFKYNGTTSTDTRFAPTYFVPEAGTYIYKTYYVSGTHPQIGQSVLEISDANGNLYQPNPRCVLDFRGDKQSTVNISSTVAPNVKGLMLWIWTDGQQVTYSDFAFRVKVEKNNTETPYSPVARVSNVTYGDLPVPTRNGFTFGGWYKEASCVNQIKKGDEIAANTLYAKWIPIDYTLTLEYNENGTVRTETLPYTALTTITLPNPGKTGYTISDWSITKADGSWTPVGRSEPAGYVIPGNAYGNATIRIDVMPNNYTLSFDAMNGTVDSASKTVTYDAAYGELPTPTRDGYTFDGWYDTPAYGTQITSSTVYKTAADTTVYAKWTADSQTLTVDSNGGVNSANLMYIDEGTNNDAIEFKPDGINTFSGGHANSITYSGSIDQDGMDVSGTFKVLANSQTGAASSETTTMLPVWVYLEQGKTYEYSYTSSNEKTSFYLFRDGSSNVRASISKHNGTTYSGIFTVGEYNAFNTGDTTWHNSDSTGFYQLRLDQDHEKTEIGETYNYEISDFVIREVTPDAVSQYKQPTDTKIYIPDPVRGGYTFNGWTGSVANLGADKYYTFNSDANNLVANWIADTYTLTYDLAGGTMTGDSVVSYTPDDTVTIASAPTRTGYTFMGWLVTTADGNWVENSPCNPGEQTPTGMYGNVTLTAQWEKNTYTYTVKHNKMNLDGTTYTTDETEEVTLTTGATHTFATKSYTGFTAPEAVTVTVDGTGDLTVEYNYTRNKYTVTAKAGTGISSVTGAGEYYYGASVTLNAVVKAGYTWLNWTKDGTNDANTAQSYSFNMGAGNVAWTANANPTSVAYTVKHLREDLSGAYTIEETENLTAQVDTSVTPAVKNYTGFTAPATQTVTVKGDGSTVVTYKYERNSYIFTTNVDGVTTPTTYKYEQAVDAPATPTKTGYTFAGWDGTVPDTMPANDVTVTATWTINSYTVTYKVNGVVVKTETYEYAANITPYTYTETGYSVSAWTGESHTTMPAKNLEYTATATIIEYNITYDLQGGDLADGVTNPGKYTVESESIILNNPTKQGYTFAGWTGTGLTSATNPVTIPTGSTENRSYTATWTPAQNTYTIETYTMDTAGNYGAAVVTTGNGLTGNTATVEPEAKEGFTVDSTSVLSGTIEADGSLVLKVYYKRNQFTLTVTAGTGVNTVAGGGSYYYGAILNMTATLKNGYQTVVWSDGTTTYTPGISTMPNKALTLTATASPIGYTVSYDLAGGAVSGTNPTSYNVETASFTLINPTKNGYDFLGWTGTGLDAASTSVTVAKGSTGDRAYTATWAPTTYTITYNYDGGSVATANPTTYNIESEEITLVIPTKQGYAFAGWTGTGITGTTDSVIIATGSTGNRTYTATWTESNADYTVKHYRQNLDGTYTALLETEVISSTTGKTETAALKSYDGFTAPEAKTVTVLADGSATVEYYYTRNSYKIVYYTVNADDAQIEFKTIEALYEAPVTAITDVPTRTGYAFTKWDTECPTTMPLNGLEIVALWNPSEFEITYVGIYDEQTYPATHTFDTETTLPNPTRTGYTFAGWEWNGNNLGTNNVVIGKRQFSDDFTLTATWTANPVKYTVETYLMDTTGAYPTTATSSVQKDAVTDAAITAAHETMTGFSADAEKSVLTGTAAHDGSSVLKLYYSRNQYALTLEMGTGIAEVTGAKEYYYQESVTVNASMLAGYDWDKWTQGDAAFTATQNHTFEMPAEALTIKANAKLHTYNINITLNNGAFAAGYTAPTSYDVTKEDITIPDPTRTGYTFNGWLVNGASAPVKDYTIDTALAVDVTLVADWTAIEYKITYVLDGGINAESNPDFYTIESAEIKLEDPTRTGYEFVKWTEGDTIEAGSTGDKTFTAEWKALGVEYNIVTHFEGFTAGNFDTFENGTGSADADSTVQIDDIAAAKTGFTFKEARLTEGGDTVTQFKNGTKDGEVTVHLYYTRNSYTVTFDSDGGDAVEAQTYKYGATVSLPDTLNKTGYTFNGWDKEIPAMPAENVTVKALWNINQYTITFANTGDSTIDPITQDYNTAVTAPADPTKTGYTFAGWDKEIPATMPAEDLTISATWTINQYTVTFDTDGGSEIAPITQDYDTTITKPADPSKTGYTFAGWDKEIPEKMPAENVTITAQWTINQYTITFNTDGGTAIDAITADFGTAVTAPANPTKTGYTFDGWDVAIPETMPAENMTITAKWTINKYTITFNTDGGSTVSAITQDYNSAVTAPSDPTKSGYTFAGWDKPIPSVMPAENITITAKWEIVNYKINYELDDGENNPDNPDTYTVEQSVTLKAPTKTGYTFDKWEPTDTIGVGSTGDKTFTAKWTPNQNTKFTVEYYIQPVSGATELTAYTLHSSDATKTGTSDAETEVAPIDIDGFKTPANQTVYVKADGSAVVKFYYARESYTITFDTDGGSEVGSITALFEGAVTAPANPTKTGYTFAGWNKTIPNTMPLNGDTIKATWTANVYTVSYDYDVPEGVTVTHTGNVPTAHTYGTTSLVSDPERAGYTFAGWIINNTGTAVKDLTLAADGYTADITLKATWTADKQKYTVVYYKENLNGEYVEFNRTTENEAETDSTVTLTPDAQTGFTLNAEKSELTAIVPTDSSLVMKVYYDRNAYTVTWDVEGVTSTETYLYGQTIVKPADPVKTGYTFHAWTPDVPATMPAENKTFTAKFLASTDTAYTVVHKLEDLNADTYTVKETENLTGTTASEVTPAVKSYVGFTAPVAQTVIIAADGSTVVEYLYTRNSYTVTVVATDAGLSNATQTQTLEYEATLNVSVTVADGYKFNGWTSSDEALVANNANTSFTLTVPAGAVTLTASAEIIKYTVSYELDNGALAEGVTNPIEYDVTTDTFTLNNPTKLGYTFTGWTGSNGNTAETEVTVTKGTFGNLSYKANWSLDQYGITYHLDGGSETTANPTYYTVTSGTIKLNVPKKTGYTFTGWTGTGLDGKVMEVTIPTGSVGAREYTATWEANTQTYYVDLYVMDIDGTYPDSLKERQEFTAKTAEKVEFTMTERTGFTIDDNALLTGTIPVTDLASEALVLKGYYIRNQYDVTLTGDAGIASLTGAGENYYYGQEVAVKAVVKPGYTWVNWTGTFTKSEQEFTFIVPANDVTLAANTTLDTYTITYSGLEGSTGTESNPADYNVNSAPITLVNPEKVGYTFTGWTGTDLAGSDMNVTIPTGSTGNRAYVANWNINTYNLTYDLADGTLAEGESIPATYNVETKVTLPTPTRVGYTFAGWSDGTTTAMSVVLDGAIGDRHYTATWTPNGNTKYTVKHYQMNLDGTYNETATTTVEFFDGVSDGFVTPAVNNYEGFTSPTAETVKVEPDGSTVVEYYYIRNQYTLTYVIAGSESVVNTYYYGTTLPETPTATRDGYTFSAWDTTTPETMPANDLTITALWNTVAYTITFNANGGNAMTAINYNIETAVTLPKAERVGYDFNGWTVTYTDGTGNWASTIADNNAVLSAGLWGNVTITANWTARQDTKYVVKHMFMNVDGTAYVEDETKRVNATGTSDTKVTPEVLSVTGFTSPVAQEVTIAADGSTIVVYEYKRNQYTLTWKIKGSAEETVTYYYGANVTAKADPVLPGHTFTGWSRDIPATMPAEHIEILANFDIITYTITYNYNGGDLPAGVTNPTTYTVETETFTINNPVWAGYAFGGWRGSYNGTNITIPKGSTGDLTLEAMWAANLQDWYIDIYYMNTDGSYNSQPDKVLKNYYVADHDREDQQFTGCKVSFDIYDPIALITGFTPDTANSVLEGTVPGTGNIHLVAKYTRNQHTFTFDSAGGTAVADITAFYDVAITKPADPTRTGYTFNGWSQTIPDKMPDTDMHFIATWDADEYVLTLDENGGTAVEDITYTIESTDVLPTISRAGYFFEGWKVTTADGAWELADANYAAGTALKGKYGSATLTAQWTTVQYTLEFNTTHGTVDPASITYTVEDTTNVLPTPVRPGYTFTGWLVTEVKDDTQSPGYIYWNVDQVYDAGAKLTDTYGNAKFTAQWQENTYNVTVDAANITYTGANEATVDVDYTATLTPHAGYTLPDTITVTVGGNEIFVGTGYTYTVNADGTATLEIDGAYIIGDVEIKVVREIITYEISYDYANATVKPANPASYNVETATITLIAPERTGYTFLGWTGSNGTTAQTEVSIPVGSTGDKNYVANWQADAKQYTVEIYYMTTDGTYNSTPDKSWTLDAVTDAQVSYNINDPATLLTGFSANESISTLTGKVPATGALTLVAKYDRNKYALTVNGCEGITAATGTVEYFYDKEIVVDATVAMGYTWVEWKSADETALAGSADKKYTFKMPANAAILTAVATLDVYDIGYDLAGGSLADGVSNPATYTVTTDTFTLNNPTKVGYDFIGWTGTDLAVPTMNVTIAKNSTTGAKSYTANWKAIEYTVSYDLAGGTAQGSNYTKYTIESPSQTLTAPVRTGYTFLGWTGSNGDVPQTEVKIAGGAIGDLSFKANWSADSHYYTVEVRYMTTEGVYPAAADESEQILSETDAQVSVTHNAPEGFTFDPNGSILSGTVDHEDKLVLKVYYSRNTYELTLVDGGAGIDSVNTKTTTVYYGADVEISAAVSNGYTFEKWTSDNASVAGSTTNPYTFKMPAGGVKLTASATLNTYKINYTLNDGTNDAANPATYTVLDTVVIKQPTRLGYTFTGWTGTYYGKDVVIAAGTTGDINLTATWKINTYTVTYNLDGGSVSGNPTSYNVTDSFTLYNPTKVGYDFVGWKGTGIDGTQENVTVSAGTTGNLEFTAVWKARPDTKYTVNYYLENVNGDQTYTLGADSFVGEHYSDQQITPDVPVYTGFTTPVAQTKVVNADGTTVFNFYYERNIYTYTFKAVGYEDDVYKYYYEYPVAKPTDPVRNGYTFEGWNPVVVDKMPAYDVTSVAQWKAINYSVGYDLAGGTVSGNPTSYTVEDSFTLVNPTRAGYTFVGWSGTDIDGTSTLVSVGVGNTGNRSYTAVWTPTRYEITYELDGGTDNGENPISYSIEDSITLVNPTKVGYRFLGWTGTGVYGYSSYVTFSGSIGDRAYTAHWTPANDTPYTVKHYQQDIGANTYTLFEEEVLTGTTLTTVSPVVKTYPGFTSPSRTSVEIKPDGTAVVEYYYTRNNYTIYFDSNGGSDVASQTYAFGETVVPPVNPSFLGYTFAGWNPALPETMTAGNLYVTANWQANSDTPYTVYHYFQDVDCISYPEELCIEQICYGETGAIVEVATLDQEGFTAPATRSIVIAADGSRVVRYYYTRNTYTVTFVDHNDNILSMQSVVYGLPATPPALEDRAPDAEGHYTFTGWSEDTSFVHGYTTIKALYSVEAHDPGPEATCTEALICTVCDYEIAPANGHLPVVQTPAVEPTCTTAGNTADSVCSVCGEVLSRYQIVPALGHEIGSWYVDVPATATTTGVLKRVCSRCDWNETHEIPVLSDTPVVSIDITTAGSQAYVGTSYQLMTKIMPENAANKQVIWESSDPSIASVTKTGYVISHKPGEVTFTVTTLDGLKTDSITINFYYSADHYNVLILDIFGCELFLDGMQVEESVADFIRVKAGSTLAFTLKPTTDAYDTLGGYILTANGSNVAPDANGVYYIHNVHENIEITALPLVGEPEFDDDQQYDTDEVPEKSIFAKILEFFERIIEWFRNLFK